MQKIIVTLVSDGMAEKKDIEVPANIKSSEIILGILHDDKKGQNYAYKLHADPPGRMLGPDETFEEAGVWNGSILTLKKIK